MESEFINEDVSIHAKARLRAERLRAARIKGRHTDREWIEMCQRFGYRCLKCGSDKHLVKDHIIPIYAGGSDGIENIQPLCQSCNSRKGPERVDYREQVREA